MIGFVYKPVINTELLQSHFELPSRKVYSIRNHFVKPVKNIYYGTTKNWSVDKRYVTKDEKWKEFSL